MDIDITFQGLDRSEPLDTSIRDHADKLVRHHPRLVACHVTVASPHRHHRQGRRFQVKVHLTGPDREIVVSHDAGHDGAHEDAYVTVRDAFRAALRQLDDQE